MIIYRLLSKIRIFKSYSVKLLFIAVIGIHIPMIGLAVFLSSHLSAHISVSDVFFLTFGLTFLASAISLFLLHEMMAPLKETKNALRTYLHERKLPHLPVHYHDEVGVVMQSVQKTVESLDELIQEKQDMIALLSHDLRSPVNSATSIAELIKMKSEDEVIHDYCDKIIGQNEKQLHLVHTVLNMLRQDHFYIEDADKHPERLLDLVNEAERNLEVDLKQKHVRLVKEIPANLKVKAQYNIFLQVLVNILHNAIKFSPRQARVILRAHQVQHHVKIEIQDFGLGFESEKDHNKAFDRFTSLKRRGTEGEPSTGIGLYLCKKIIQRHSGEIHVSSEGKNKGSTFCITLPV